jgi:alanine racemase
MKIRRRTEAVIDLTRLSSNAALIRRRLKPGVQFMAVLKGDAYGHGIEGVIGALEEAGADQYAVATWEEGAKIRACGSTKPILILDDIGEYDLDGLLDNHLMPTVYTLSMAQELNDTAAQKGTTAHIHIKIDTGLHRVGFLPGPEAIDQIEAISRLPHVKIDGIFSHFARADQRKTAEVGADGLNATQRQLQTFLSLTEELQRRGVDVGLRHIMNSPSFLLYPEAQLDMARVGDVLFGLSPTDEVDLKDLGFQQVLSWYTRVAMVKELPAGEEIGYEGGYTTKRPTRVATLPVGFADGFRWNLSNKGCVRVRGKLAPIIGRVCMDQCMVDVTDIEGVERGDTVSLIDDDLTIEKMAKLLSTNIDEIACDISPRVPKRYIR